MTAHTPTPWKVSDYRPYEIIPRSQDESTYEQGDNGFPVVCYPTYNAKANAEFIVRACNAHVQLVETLKESFEAMLNLCPVAREKECVCGIDSVKPCTFCKVKKALAKAGAA